MVRVAIRSGAKSGVHYSNITWVSWRLKSPVTWLHPSKCILPSYLSYKSRLSRQWNCWPFWSCWSIACRRSSNYIFILDLTPGFNILHKDNWKARWETFKFSVLVRVILEIWRYFSGQCMTVGIQHLSILEIREATMLWCIIRMSLCEHIIIRMSLYTHILSIVSNDRTTRFYGLRGPPCPIFENKMGMEIFCRSFMHFNFCNAMWMSPD